MSPAFTVLGLARLNLSGTATAAAASCEFAGLLQKICHGGERCRV